jgi:hypothetical protein
MRLDAWVHERVALASQLGVQCLDVVHEYEDGCTGSAVPVMRRRSTPQSNHAEAGIVRFVKPSYERAAFRPRAYATGVLAGTFQPLAG